MRIGDGETCMCAFRAEGSSRVLGVGLIVGVALQFSPPPRGLGSSCPYLGAPGPRASDGNGPGVATQG